MKLEELFVASSRLCSIISLQDFWLLLVIKVTARPARGQQKKVF